jgi:hypothetical protein
MESVATMRAQISDEQRRVSRLLRQTRALDGEFEKVRGLVRMRVQAVAEGHPALEAAFESGTTLIPEQLAEEVNDLGPDRLKQMASLLEAHNAALKRLLPSQLTAIRTLHVLAHKVAVAKAPTNNNAGLKRLLNSLQLTRLRLEAERAELPTAIHQLDKSLRVS